VRWIFIILLMGNGIYFLWQNYLVQEAEIVATSSLVEYGEDGDTVALVLLAERLSTPTTLVPDLGESKNGERPGEESSAAATEPVVAETSAVCWLIGPFQEEISAKQVISRLSALDVTLRLRAIDTRAKPDYWVYIPPQVSRKAAIKLLRELQSKKIDSFLITEGDRKNGISLGFFTQKERADGVMKARKDQGYNPSVREILRVDTEFWLIFDQRQSGKFSDALWETINQGNEALERRKNYCDKIASADNFD
jgi:hypothetical protein